MNAFLAFMLLLANTIAGTSSHAVSQADPAPVEATIISETDAVVPGGTVRLGVVFKLDLGWHIYYKEPGDIGRATEVTLVAPDGFKPLDTQWQPPAKFISDGFKTYGYEQATIIALPVQVPADLKPGDTITIKVSVNWLACRTECIPGETELTITLPVVAAAADVHAVNASQFARVGFQGDPDHAVSAPEVPPAAVNMTLLGALLFAFIGGVLLNLMPCVLPVLFLKVMTLVKQAGADRKTMMTMGLAYTAGTLATFAVLAAIVIGVQAGGNSIGWGFQFQHPLFVIAMVTLVTVMSLSLFGILYFGISGGQAIHQMADREGLAGAFAKGVSATILSTPCTAPFLGSALGFAFSQPWWAILAIFLTIGLGLSAPYLALCANPGWKRFLPKPGVWMEHFKEAMGFLMLGSGVWLLYVLGKQGGAGLVTATVAFLVTVSFAAWGVGRFAGLEASNKRRYMVWALALLLAAGSFWTFVVPALDSKPTAVNGATMHDGVLYEPYSQEALDRHLAAGKVVMLDFTAEWCLTCKANEQVLKGSTVSAKMRELDVVVLVADWTRQDDAIAQLLKKYGRSGVPLYVIHTPTGRNPIVLPELITPGIVTDALEKARVP